MPPDELPSFDFIVTAACNKPHRVLHGLFTSVFFVLIAWAPHKLGTCLQNVLLFPSWLNSAFSSHPSDVFRNKDISGTTVCRKKGCKNSTLEPISSIIHTLYCAPKTLWCLKLEWLFMQTEALAVQVTGYYCRQNWNEKQIQLLF